MTPDFLLAGMELACEIDEGFDASGWASSDSSMATIAYEEAIERELEYQKRKGLSSVQSPADSSFLSMPSRELALNPSLTGAKRKEISGILPEPVPKPMSGQKLPPKLLPDCTAPSQQFEFRQPPMPQLQQQKPLLQQSNARQPLQQSQQFMLPQPHQPQVSLNQQHQQHNTHGQQPLGQGQQYIQMERPLSLHQQRQQHNPQGQQTLGQGQQYRQLQPNHSLNQQPLQHTTQFRHHPFWCNLCQMNCESPKNLKIHRQGRKHRAKMEEIHRGKKNNPVHNTEMLWCKECNVPCMNEMALAQHRAGKKHIAIIQALQGHYGAPAAGMNMIYNG